MLNWSAHLTMLFKEYPFVQRFAAAAAAGFQAVEFMWPLGIDPDELVAAQQAAGVSVALFNVDSGDVAAGERGFPNDPARRGWWRERTLAALELAERLGCNRMNVQAGNRVDGLERTAMLDCLAENLAWALAQNDAVALLLEPLNRFEHPHYLLSRTSEALEVLERVHQPRLQLMLDVYHTQRSEGNLVRLLEENMPQIGHIQIADSPERHQPGTGEINWRRVLGEIEELGYAGFIGLEYNPRPDTLESLGWLPESGRAGCEMRELRL